MFSSNLTLTPARLRSSRGRTTTSARSQNQAGAEQVTSKQADILDKLRRDDTGSGATSRRDMLKYPALALAAPKPMVMQQAGPYAWGATCAVGDAQSPVDLPFSKQPCSTKDIREVPAQRITTRFRMTDKCCITNGGHGTMQVNFPEGSCGSVIGNKKLELLQFHFHTPSEHALNSKRYAMEAHLVHREIGTDNLTVLGVMIQRAKGAPSNPALRKALDLAPEQGGKTAQAFYKLGGIFKDYICTFKTRIFKNCSMFKSGFIEVEGDCTMNFGQVCNDKTGFNPVDLLPDTFLEGRRSYLNYRGSLTTPPCTEGVNWYVYTDPIAVADEDIFDFIEWCGSGTVAFNSRPLYPMNDREWILYKEG